MPVCALNTLQKYAVSKKDSRSAISLTVISVDSIRYIAFFIFILGTLAATALYFVNQFNGNVALSVFLLALLTGCMHGVNMNLICILPPILAGNSKVSSVSGLLNSFTYVGSAISMYVIPLIADKADWSVTILMWIGFAGFGTLLNLLCQPIWKKYKEKQSV